MKSETLPRKILVVDCGSKKVPGIEKIAAAVNCAFDTTPLKELTEIGDEYIGVIISGAPILLTEVEHTPYLEKAKLLFSDPLLPVLGICFGHQLMGLYHGAAVSRCREDRDFQEINFVVAHPFVRKSPGIVRFHEDHCECITLPENFMLQASSAICTNEAMEHADHPWFGVQFHPETSGQDGHDFIANFIRYCEDFR